MKLKKIEEINLKDGDYKPRMDMFKNLWTVLYGKELNIAEDSEEKRQYAEIAGDENKYIIDVSKYIEELEKFGFNFKEGMLALKKEYFELS